MALTRFVAFSALLAALLAAPAVTTAQGARGTPTPTVPSTPSSGQRIGGPDEIGPLEKRANPITPENPIPRRVHSVVPLYPQEAASSGVTATLTLRATLDSAGHVAEARQTAVSYTLAPNSGAPSSTQLSAAFRKSAIDAVRQWLYDPPIDAPISLYVQLTFAPNSDATVAWHDATPPPARPGVVGGVVGGVAGGIPPGPPPPPPGLAPVRVGGQISPPKKIRDVTPVYPPLASSAKVSGIVIIETIVGADGHVVDARVIRSIPLLDDAALAAVRQWEFTPTLLNGVPTPIIMSVTVNFSLDR